MVGYFKKGRCIYSLVNYPENLLVYFCIYFWDPEAYIIICIYPYLHVFTPLIMLLHSLQIQMEGSDRSLLSCYSLLAGSSVIWPKTIHLIWNYKRADVRDALVKIKKQYTLNISSKIIEKLRKKSTKINQQGWNDFQQN